MSLPADRLDDSEYQRLIALLRESPRASRDGRLGPHIAAFTASWPEDAEHAELTAIAERLLARFSGRLEGATSHRREVAKQSPSADRATRAKQRLVEGSLPGGLTRR